VRVREWADTILSKRLKSSPLLIVDHYFSSYYGIDNRVLLPEANISRVRFPPNIRPRAKKRFNITREERTSEGRGKGSLGENWAKWLGGCRANG